MITVYGIKNCDTCRKALKWLEAEGHAHRFHDFRNDGLDEKLVSGFINKLGLAAVLNRKSTSWRGLDEATKAVFAKAESESDDQAAVVALLAGNPTLIKRPVFDTGKQLLNGFAAGQMAVLSGD
jgi:arsenate reductase (glutaredoxin)